MEAFVQVKDTSEGTYNVTMGLKMILWCSPNGTFMSYEVVDALNITIYQTPSGGSFPISEVFLIETKSPRCILQISPCTWEGDPGWLLLDVYVYLRNE